MLIRMYKFIPYSNVSLKVFVNVNARSCIRLSFKILFKYKSVNQVSTLKSLKLSITPSETCNNAIETENDMH